MFDRLMLMAKGKIIYFNQADKAVDYFSQISFNNKFFKCPELSNPSDYFMSIMSIETIEPEEVLEFGGPNASVQSVYAQKIDNFSQNYQRSALKNDENYLDPRATPIS